jgi:L-threonylcarbamoyladenylate synthase
MPVHPIALQLIRRAALPLAAPSANRFTGISPTTADHVRQGLGDLVDMIIDGGPSQVGIESTVISLAGEKPALLRPGMISIAQIEELIGPVYRVSASSTEAHPAPGMHEKHYAPRTPLYILGNSDVPPSGKGKLIGMASDPIAYAASLYAELHAADVEGWDWLAIEAPPRTSEWAAIWDRLRRAAYSLPDGYLDDALGGL